MNSSTVANEVQIRRASREDAALCGRICYEAFTAINEQHRFPPDIPSPKIGIGLLEMLFAHPGFYTVVAEIDGQVVGSNCLDERSAIAGVGPLTVAPDVQNRSVGRMLMQAVIDRAYERSFPGIRLVQAAFHSRSLSLYTKLGFDAREQLSVVQGAPIGKVPDGWKVRRATEGDLGQAAQLCEAVHGHHRSGELRDAMRQGIASVAERRGRITAYSSGLGFYGHSVAESNLDLQALIGAADEFSGPGILVPTRNSSLLRWCLENGLRIVEPMTLMTMGLYNEPKGAYLPSIAF
ncbi:MAG: GNAT family N-acetyltransferase [Bryobacteraceae bacterium]